MSVSFGAQTGLVLVDARPQAGRCFLPLSATLLGRTVMIKDQFGVAAVSSIQVLTNSPDTFEDGTTSRWITHGYRFMTIAATASNVWTVVGGVLFWHFSLQDDHCGYNLKMYMWIRLLAGLISTVQMNKNN